MAVIELANGILSGLTADTKPTTYPAGTLYLDTQTGLMWVYIGSTWTRNNTPISVTSKVTGDTPYTATVTDSVIRINNSASSSNFILNLPTAVGISGTIYTIARTDIAASTNITKVDAASTETIDGNLVYNLFPGESITIQSDGTNWNTISRPEPSRMGYYFLKGSTPNRRYTSHIGSGVNVASTTSPAASTLWAIPFIVSRTTQFDLISFRVTTLGPGNARAGIYRDNGNCYPGALIFDTGSIDVSTGSTTVVRDTTITSGLQTFQPGLYWLAWENDGGATTQYETYNGLTQGMTMLGQDNAMGAANASYGYSVAHTFGALPDPYTAAATLLTTAPGATNPIVLVGLRPV